MKSAEALTARRLTITRFTRFFVTLYATAFNSEECGELDLQRQGKAFSLKEQRRYAIQSVRYINNTCKRADSIENRVPTFHQRPRSNSKFEKKFNAKSFVYR